MRRGVNGAIQSICSHLKTGVRLAALAGLFVGFGAAGAFADQGERVNAKAKPGTWQWVIKKDHWDADDEKAFERFVYTIGMSDCVTVNECLRGAHNPYRHSDPAGAYYYADCADFPYLLRAYFAWKNNLPFSHVDGVAARGGARDARYSPKGNVVARRRDVTMQPGQTINANQVFRDITNWVSSAMFRFHPDTDVRGSLYNDHYPTEITQRGVRAGTVLYDPNGHVTVVYRVDARGLVHFVDAHPDGTVTRGTFGKRFLRTNPGAGWGFKNWRPTKLVGYTTRADGALIGGRYVGTPNKDLSDYSAEQYYGNVGTVTDAQWKQAKFEYLGEPLDFYDFVRARMAGRALVYKPVEELRIMMRTLCEDLAYRENSVMAAIRRRIQDKPQPFRMPPNIYGTFGEWEMFSTPSRDARLKTSFKELRDAVQRFVSLHRAGDKKVEYNGANLILDLYNAYEEEAAKCTVRYRRTDNSLVTLGYDDVVARLFKLGFDPYHCIERRWGATKADELSTCQDGETKRAWYDAQQRLRNQIDRDYTAQHGFTLADLQAKVPDSGVDEAPDVDLRGYLEAEMDAGGWAAFAAALVTSPEGVRALNGGTIRTMGLDERGVGQGAGFAAFTAHQDEGARAADITAAYCAQPGACVR